MARDPERLARIRRALDDARLDALVCSLPSHVLLLTGYWPVIGTCIAIVSRDGRTAIVAPEDELSIAGRSGVDRLYAFQPGSVEILTQAVRAVAPPLSQAADDLALQGRRIGYVDGAASQPASYAALHLYGGDLFRLLSEAIPRTSILPANRVLEVLAAACTPAELALIRQACRTAAIAYAEGAGQLRPGLSELEAAAAFRTPLSTRRDGLEPGQRADGFVYCMSGPRAAEAHAAYARSRPERLEPGELILVHCNSNVDGYWTDVTRTYTLGEPDRRRLRMLEAVLEARQAALEAVRPGVPAREVDRAARESLASRGFSAEFKHGTGHGVGFAAIDHAARPRIHPASDDVLEPGMVFNVEPAVYVDGVGGVRHCDMVAVTPDGAELLTPFQADLESLILRKGI